METAELKKTWQDQEKRLDKLWTLNMNYLEQMQTQKAKSKLRALAVFKSIAVILGIVYVAFLGLLVYGNHFKNPFFGISISVIMLFTVFAIVVYTRQILLMQTINYNGNILSTQQKLSLLQSSTINIVRILWLQMPFWSTWFWNRDWIANSGLSFWLIAVPITLCLSFAAIWLYRNISLKNSNKKWFKLLLSMEWSAVSKARAFLDEIEEFKRS